jgi:putative DNA primase/helicase
VDERDAISQKAKQTVRDILLEAYAIDDQKKRGELLKHQIKSEGDSRIRAMIARAQSEPGIPAVPDELDTDPWLFNVQNGTIDLRTGQMRDHDRVDLITKIAPITYDLSATCPTFDRFLAHIMPSQEMRVFLQRAVGYSLTGSTREDVIFINWGEGNNGKSTFMTPIMAMLGTYATQTQMDTLMIKQHQGVRDDVADLQGARFVAAAEGNDGQRLAEGLVKQLTGGDRVKARHLYGRLFEFTPQFKLWLSTNYRPVIRGTDKGIWRRIRLVPFTVTIPDEEQDKSLAEHLEDELPGILNWALAGCLDWQRNGLGTPEAVENATKKYREEMDIIGTWLAEHCVESPRMVARASDLYASYKRWCEETGEYAISQKRLGTQLGARGFEREKDRNGWFWWGIGLTSVTHVTHGDPFTQECAREEKTIGNSANTGHDPSHGSRDDVDAHGTRDDVEGGVV